MGLCMFFLINRNTNLSSMMYLFLLGVSQQVFASDEIVFPTEQDYLSDFSVTSATRLAQSPRDLPVSVTVITRKMIDASGATEIPDLFRLVPGFRVNMGDGGTYNVFGHGAGNSYARKLEVLVDGLPVQSPFFNTIDWLSIPVEISDVDYIEVMRGSSTAVYGSNAYDGAINIVTRKPFEEQGGKYQVTFGDPGFKKHQYSYGFLSDKGSHKVSLVKKSNTGFEARNDSNENIKFRYNGNLTPTVNDEIDILMSANTGFKGDEDLLGNLRQRDVDSNSQFLRWNHQTSGNNSFTLKLYHFFVDYDDSYSFGLISKLYNINPNLVPVYFNGHQDQELVYGLFTAKSDRYGLDIQQTFQYSDLRLVVGSAIVKDKIKSKFTFGDRGGVTGTSKQIFSNFEWRVREDLVLNAGLMVEKIEERNAEVSKRLSVNYHINDNNTLRFGIAESFRGRSVYSANTQVASRYKDDDEIFSTVLDNRGYDTPENVQITEVAQLVKIPGSNLSYDWRLFRENYSNFRVVVNDSSYPDDARNGAFVSINGGSYSVEGAELQMKYEYDNDWFIAAQYTKTKTKGSIANNLTSTTFIDFKDAMPEKSYGFLLSMRLHENTNLGFTYTRLSYTSFPKSVGAFPSYKRLDFNLSNRFKIGKSNARLEILGQNILDDYSEYRTSQIFESRMFIRFSLEY